MNRRLWPLIAIVTLGAAALGARQLMPAKVADRLTELKKLLDSYMAGHSDVVAAAPPRQFDQPTQLALSNLYADPKVPWHPRRAAFLLEVAMASFRASPLAIVDWPLQVGRRLVITRPGAIGTNSVEDRFEVLWHQVALALMQGTGAWPGHDAYLNAIGLRAVQVARLSPPIANRFLLARAMNAAERCCPSRPHPATVVSSGGQSVERETVTVDEALALFSSAAEEPSLREEALVRAAQLCQRIGRLDDAHAKLDLASPIRDSVLAYSGALIRAGVFDLQGRPDAAADAYGAAMLVAPGAQVPAIGRASALQRAGRIQEAYLAAEQTRRMSVDGGDPWITFLRADARFAEEWLAELRKLIVAPGLQAGGPR